jgi:hypothetical protein
VKIPSLLAQYLYSKQRLDLPGIGTFLLDNDAIAAFENNKQRSAVLEGVSFKFNPAIKESAELVAFIAEKTGKMKPLAAADLDSYLQSAHIFLNIGKPFTFEGIGILSRIKPGEFELTPISVSTDKVKEYNTKETGPSASKETVSDKYESFLSSSQVKQEWKRPVAALLVLCGIGLTIWGGYEISRRAKKGNSDNAVETAAQTILPAPDSLQARKDSIVKQDTPVEETNYKYVLEVAKSKRAFKRYNQLKEINWQVHLETKDSVQYKLFMLLPVSDTTKTRDSLMVVTGRKVYIEYGDQTN